MSSICHNVLLYRCSSGCPAKWFSQLVENLGGPQESLGADSQGKSLLCDSFWPVCLAWQYDTGASVVLSIRLGFKSQLLPLIRCVALNDSVQWIFIKYQLCARHAAIPWAYAVKRADTVRPFESVLSGGDWAFSINRSCAKGKFSSYSMEMLVKMVIVQKLS